MTLAFIIIIFLCRCSTCRGRAKHQLNGQSPSTDCLIITTQSSCHGESSTSGPLPQHYRGCRGGKKQCFEPSSHVQHYCVHIDIHCACNALHFNFKLDGTSLRDCSVSFQCIYRCPLVAKLTSVTSFRTKCLILHFFVFYFLENFT